MFSLPRRLSPGICRLFMFLDNKPQYPEISLKAQGSIVQDRVFVPNVSSCAKELPEAREYHGPADGSREVEDTGETLRIV